MTKNGLFLKKEKLEKNISFLEDGGNAINYPLVWSCVEITVWQITKGTLKRHAKGLAHVSVNSQKKLSGLVNPNQEIPKNKSFGLVTPDQS